MHMIENYQSPLMELFSVDVPSILCSSPGNGVVDSTMQGVDREEFEW